MKASVEEEEEEEGGLEFQCFTRKAVDILDVRDLNG